MKYETYELWKLALICLIINETRVSGNLWKLAEINCVLEDDCDYPQSFKDGDTPEEIWQGELDAIADSQ
jgi:hypothetical protein